MNKKNLTIWIIIGVILGIVIIFTTIKSGVVPKPVKQPSGTETVLPTGEAARIAAPGTSAVTEKGTVVTPEGAPARNDVTPGSPEAPKQSDPVSVESLPPETIKIEMSAAGIVPNTFSVKAGQAVTISVTSNDQTHVFKFREPSLEAVAIGVAGNETRAITFNAPAAKGEYEFYCDVPGHAARGETGKMTVK